MFYLSCLSTDVLSLLCCLRNIHCTLTHTHTHKFYLSGCGEHVVVAINNPACICLSSTWTATATVLVGCDAFCVCVRDDEMLMRCVWGWLWSLCCVLCCAPCGTLERCTQIASVCVYIPWADILINYSSLCANIRAFSCHSFSCAHSYPSTVYFTVCVIPRFPYANVSACTIYILYVFVCTTFENNLFVWTSRVINLPHPHANIHTYLMLHLGHTFESDTHSHRINICPVLLLLLHPFCMHANSIDVHKRHRTAHRMHSSGQVAHPHKHKHTHTLRKLCDKYLMILFVWEHLWTCVCLSGAHGCVDWLWQIMIVHRTACSTVYLHNIVRTCRRWLWTAVTDNKCARRFLCREKIMLFVYDG